MSERVYSPRAAQGVLQAPDPGPGPEKEPWQYFGGNKALTPRTSFTSQNARAKSPSSRPTSRPASPSRAEVRAASPPKVAKAKHRMSDEDGAYLAKALTLLEKSVNMLHQISPAGRAQSAMVFQRRWAHARSHTHTHTHTHTHALFFCAAWPVLPRCMNNGSISFFQTCQVARVHD